MSQLDFEFLFPGDATTRAARSQVETDSCRFQLSWKYRTYYQFFRPVMPIAVRQLLQRGRKVETDENWYLPRGFMQMIARCSAEDAPTKSKTIHPWPHGAKFAFVLTHDVETAEGLKQIPRIADAEQELGFRSSWNLIPYKYKIDTGLVRELQSRGFEFGIHGYNHDGQLFSSQKVFERRAIGINEAIRKYDAVGFRAPMVHRNLDWLQRLDIEYDSSCFDIDPFQAAPGGVGSIWPFIAGRFVELPYTLPQDHTLFIGMGERDDRIWRRKLEFIIRHQGMALMLTHPDYLTRDREFNIYVRLLQHVNEMDGYWHSLPREVSRWWRERARILETGLEQPAVVGADSPDCRFTPAVFQCNEQGIQFVTN